MRIELNITTHHPASVLDLLLDASFNVRTSWVLKTNPTVYFAEIYVPDADNGYTDRLQRIAACLGTTIECRYPEQDGYRHAIGEDGICDAGTFHYPTQLPPSPVTQPQCGRNTGDVRDQSAGAYYPFTVIAFGDDTFAAVNLHARDPYNGVRRSTYDAAFNDLLTQHAFFVRHRQAAKLSETRGFSSWDQIAGRN